MVNALNESYYDELMLSHRQPARISHADGYVSLDENGDATFYYYLKDHLGNVRSVLTPDADGKPQVEQANDYFPFGMSFESKLPLLTKVGSGNNKLKYNGKEEQEMPGKWLDYGARFYDAQIARFHTIDKLSEKYYPWSPFVYVGNNPIKRVDPNGNDWWDIVNGSVRGVTDNLTGLNTRASYNPTDPSDYNGALDKADKVSMVAGGIMVVGGTDAAIGGAVAAAPTGGASLVVSVAGLLVAGEGALMMANATDNITEGNQYGELKEPRNVGEGKKTTPAQRKRILEENKKRNNGQLTSDGDGRALDKPTKVAKGEKANMNQAEVDHVKPKSKGGTNSNSNMQVLSKEENLRKGNR